MSELGIYETETHTNGLADIKLLAELKPFVKPHWKGLMWSFLLLPVVMVSQIAQPYLVKLTIDGPISHGDKNLLIQYSAVFLMFLAVHYTVRYIQMRLSQETGQKIVREIRLALYAHLQTLSMRFFQKNPVGKLMTRVTSDVENLSEMLSSGGLSMLQDVTIVFGGLIGMFLMEWRLALAVLAMLIVNLTVMEFFRVKTRKAYNDVRIKLAQTTAFLNENIVGMELIQLYGREARNIKRFEAISKDYYKSRVASVFYSLSFNSVVEMLTILTQVLVLWVAGNAILGGDMTFGLLSAFFLMISMVFEPIENISEKMTILQSGLASIEKVMGLMAEKPEVDEIPQPLKLPVQQSREGREIVFDNLTFAYNDDPILKDINLIAKPGQTLALVGPSGSGKTTMMKLLLRFYDPQQGRILMDGVPITQLSLHELRSQMVSIQQDDILFSRTVTENIRLRPGTFAELSADEQARVRQAAQDMNAQAVIERLQNGFDEVLLERGKNLSSGERQLILFARAIYQNPSILILDEATAAVDPYTETLIQQALQRLMAHRTVFAIAHRIATIEHADQIVVIEHGRIMEVGKHAELMVKPNGLYRRFYQYQQHKQPA